MLYVSIWISLTAKLKDRSYELNLFYKLVITVFSKKVRTMCILTEHFYIFKISFIFTLLDLK